jgi:hypothetical protein
MDFIDGNPFPTGSDLSSFADFFIEDAGQERNQYSRRKQTWNRKTGKISVRLNFF